MASFQGAFEKPQFTYDDVDVSLIPPRKRDYTSKSKGVKIMTEQSVKTLHNMKHNLNRNKNSKINY